MDTTVAYEIAHFTGQQEEPVLLERLQLIAEDGRIRLRNANGVETPCIGTDIASVIRSNPALQKVPKGQLARIACGDELLGQLPTLLEPIPDGTSLFVNGKVWDAFPTCDSDDGFVPTAINGNRPPRRHTDMMLPGHCGYECVPEMNPCWAEYWCAEGGRSFEDQLVGYSSIGILAPGIAIEHGRTDYGGNGGAVSVRIVSFDDFAAIFVDWLVNTPILSSFWQGDRYITTPEEELFAQAAAAENHMAHWNDDDGAGEVNDHYEDHQEHADEEEDCWDEGSFASRHLELHLPQALIDQVLARLHK